ncbi:hypothetical protein EGW08_012655 [Elysia chlorotica]|uniref:Prominin-like protein n=1 Tax=Elysia chlorotica TaxID=188477 RepID=A0A3S1BFI5_ELYCH|nr:hypothetical protein EGW08_012655 [Elysia chlorotica]
MAKASCFKLCVSVSFALLLWVQVSLCAPTDTDGDVYVSDKYGNVVLKDGTVRYVFPIPVGDASYSTQAKYNTQGLTTLHELARSFVKDVMPLSFPFDLLDEIVNGNFSISEDYSKIVRQVSGLAACLAIGIVFVVAFIIGGFCFCCCRFLCGNCGASGVQTYKENERCVRMGLTQALVMMLICVFAATVCTYVSNDTFTDALHFTNESVVTNVRDIGRFLNNTGRVSLTQCNIIIIIITTIVIIMFIKLSKSYVMPYYTRTSVQLIVTLFVSTEINNTLMFYYVLIHGLSYGVFKKMTEAFPTEDVIKEFTDIVETALDYDKYRRYFGLALSSVFLGLVLLYTAGVVLGIVYYDQSALPTERRAGSNLGGNLLLCGVSLTFLLGALFMLLTMFAFLFGALMEKGCEPVKDLGYFKEFLDKGKASGYSLAEITLGVKDFELSTYDALVGCRADLTPWVVLNMNQVVPLEDYLVYINYVGSIGQELAKVQSVDISMFKFVTADLSRALADLPTIGPGDVDFASINRVVSVVENIFRVFGFFLGFSPIVSNAPLAEIFCHRYLSKVLEEPVSVDIEAILSQAETIRDACNNPAQNTTNAILANSAYIDFQIQNNMTSVLLQTSLGIAGRMLSYLNSYANEVTFVIYNSLGNCRPLWNLYKSVSIVLCDYGVDTLNGFWFSLGWGLFFFVPMVVVAALLANHYKTMDVAVGYQEFDFIEEKEESEDMSMEGPAATLTTNI